MSGACAVDLPRSELIYHARVLGSVLEQTGNSSLYQDLDPLPSTGSGLVLSSPSRACCPSGFSVARSSRLVWDVRTVEVKSRARARA